MPGYIMVDSVQGFVNFTVATGICVGAQLQAGAGSTWQADRFLNCVQVKTCIRPSNRIKSSNELNRQHCVWILTCGSMCVCVCEYVCVCVTICVILVNTCVCV